MASDQFWNGFIAGFVSATTIAYLVIELIREFGSRRTEKADALDKSNNTPRGEK